MKYKRVCLGGTFSPLHAGHRSLLEEAFRRSYNVSIGLTSDVMARSSRSRQVEPFDARYLDLASACDTLRSSFGSNYEIRMIEDVIGFALEPDIDAVIVSEDTVYGALRINEMRERMDLPILCVVVIPMVRTPGGERISSTRIVQGDTTGSGKDMRGGAV